LNNYQNEKDVVCDDGIDLSDLHDQVMMCDEKTRKAGASNMTKR